MSRNFLNTINLQYITALIVVIITFYDFEKLGSFWKYFLTILLSISLLNGILGLMFMPLIFYKFKSQKNIILLCISIIILQVIAITSQNGENNTLNRIQENMNRNVFNFYKTKWYFILLVLTFIFWKLKKEFLSIFIFCTFLLFLLIDFARIDTKLLAPRYQSIMFTLFIISVFLILISFKKLKKIYRFSSHNIIYWHFLNQKK